MLDEGLDVLDSLWSGEAVNHTGIHYKAVCDGFAQPVQQPRIPVWIGGTWPSVKPMRRAAKWDGVVPIAKDQMSGGKVGPSDLAEMMQLISGEARQDPNFDIVIIGMTPDTGDTSAIAAYAEAGATWWVEASAPWGRTITDMKEQIRRGPPATRNT